MMCDGKGMKRREEDKENAEGGIARKETKIDSTLYQVHRSRISSSTFYPDCSLFTITVDQTV